MTTRVFVYEHLTSGGFVGLPESLAREGRAMLAAVLADFEACPDVASVTVERADEWSFRAAARRSDFALVIAPEFDDILARRCEWADEEGCQLLGPSVEAVRLTADKLCLAEHLTRAGVPTIPTLPFTRTPPWPPPYVCKPRFGAGSQDTFLVHILDAGRDDTNLARRASEGIGPGPRRYTKPSLARRAKSSPARRVISDRDDYNLHDLPTRPDRIVQPYLAPRHGALSLACIGGTPLLLMRQTLSADGRFRYLGGERALDVDDAPYRELARAAVEAVPGLAGYVGIDLLWPEGEDRPVVVEINPRLTTSYVGLHALCEGNLMQTLLDSVQGRAVEPPVFRAGPIRFMCDGAITS